MEKTEQGVKEDRQKTALGYASMLLLAAWQAARTEGSERSPAVLAEVEKRLEAGDASLEVHIQRIGGDMRVTAAVSDAAGFHEAFDTDLKVIDLTGPMIFSRAILDQLFTVTRDKTN